MSGFDDKIFYDKLYPYLEKICSLRHPSHEETELVNYLAEFAEKHKLEYDKDAHGNLAIYRPASSGLEHLDPILFQGHTDMVCVPNKDIFPINPIISEGWVHTGEKSTLGADNGIAIAVMLELLTMDFKKNPPIECLFTVAEEVGLVGAVNMETEKFNLKAPRMINIDSEDIKFITVGCAGAKDMDIAFPISIEENTFDSAYSVIVKGPGGHSGLLIHEKIPNVIKIAAEYTKIASDKFNIRLAEFNGGFARNAIPAEASVIMCSDEISENDLLSIVQSVNDKHKDLQPFSFNISSTNAANTIISKTSSDNFINLLNELPHGAVKMNPDTGGVLSSINLALVNRSDSKMNISMNSRSCEEKEINEIFGRIEEIASKYKGISINKEEGYPGWRPNMDSELLKAATDAFVKILDSKPEYLDIHAGLECGILMNKFQTIKEAVSIGPNLHLVHSIKEKLEISSTVEIWNVIQELIAHYSE